MESPAAAPSLPSRSRWGIALFLAGLALVGSLTAMGVFLMDRLLRTPMIEPDLPHQLRVMTWNIGKLYLQWDSRASDSDLAHVTQVIREYNPHVVALQELRDPRQLGRLVAALGPGWRGKLPEDQYDRRAALVVRLPARFQGLPTSTGRTAQAAVVTTSAGLDVSLVSVHLDAFDARRRLVQAEEILAGVRRLSDADYILAGDFNFDAAVVARETTDHRLYQFLTREMVDAGKETGATTLISRRLDYVFYHSPAVRRVRANVIRNKRFKTMDHDPVVVEFWL